MRIDCLVVGATAEDYLARGIEDFVKRLSRYSEVRIKVVRERKGRMADGARVEVEGRDLLEQVEDKALLVALDPSGRLLSSEAFAGQIGQWQQEGRRQVCFVIGGALGLSHQVRQRADLVLSLSPMTFTHEMARLLLLEQVYRAFTILAGTKYHK